MTALLASTGLIVAFAVEGAVVVAAVVVLIILIMKKKKKRDAADGQALQTKYLGSTVLSKREAKKEGATVYLVTFFCGEETTPELEVPQEVYDKVAVGQSGALLTTDGDFTEFEANN